MSHACRSILPASEGFRRAPGPPEPVVKHKAKRGLERRGPPAGASTTANCRPFWGVLRGFLRGFFRLSGAVEAAVNPRAGLVQAIDLERFFSI
jgi:hypothetical protein